MFVSVPDGWYLLLSFVFILFSLAVHEIGHAIAYRKCGIIIEEIGLGAPPPWLPSWVPSLRLPLRGRFIGITLVINPVPLGAFVVAKEKDDEKFEQLPYSDQATIFGAGLIANIIFSASALILVLLFFSALPLTSSTTLAIGFVALFIIAVVYLLRRIICFLVFPIVGAGLLVIALVGGLSMGGYILDTASSADVSGILQVTSGVGETLLLAAFFSFFLVLINILPFYPFDGGCIVAVALGQLNERARKIFQKAGPWLLFLFFLRLML